jgi:hypothetical protein
VVVARAAVARAAAARVARKAVAKAAAARVVRKAAATVAGARVVRKAVAKVAVAKAVRRNSTQLQFKIRPALIEGGLFDRGPACFSMSHSRLRTDPFCAS